MAISRTLLGYQDPFDYERMQWERQKMMKMQFKADMMNRIAPPPQYAVEAPKPQQPQQPVTLLLL